MANVYSRIRTPNVRKGMNQKEEMSLLRDSLGVNKQGESARTQLSRPLSPEELLPGMIFGGVDMDTLVDYVPDEAANKAMGYAPDDERNAKRTELPVVSKRNWENPAKKDIEGLRAYVGQAPTEIDLAPLADFANFFSTSGRKVKAPKATQTADAQMAKEAELSKLIADISAKEIAARNDMLGMLLRPPQVNMSVQSALAQPSGGGSGGSGGPRPRNPTAGEIEALSQAQSAIKGLDDVINVISGNRDVIGPVAGKWYSMGKEQDSGMITKGIGMVRDLRDPKAQKAAVVKAEVDRIRQILGSPMEGGVLRKEDEEKYRSIIGAMDRDPDAMIASLRNFARDLANRAGARVKLMRSSSINMGPEYQNYENFFNSRVSQGTQMPGGPAASPEASGAQSDLAKKAAEELARRKAAKATQGAK